MMVRKLFRMFLVAVMGDAKSERILLKSCEDIAVGLKKFNNDFCKIQESLSITAILDGITPSVVTPVPIDTVSIMREAAKAMDSCQKLIKSLSLYEAVVLMRPHLIQSKEFPAIMMAMKSYQSGEMSADLACEIINSINNKKINEQLEEQIHTVHSSDN